MCKTERSVFVTFFGGQFYRDLIGMSLQSSGIKFVCRCYAEILCEVQTEWLRNHPK